MSGYMQSHRVTWPTPITISPLYRLTSQSQLCQSLSQPMPVRLRCTVQSILLHTPLHQSPAVGSTLANGDLVSFTGALTRVAGENVGSYAIQQGTLANSNYNITFVPANFTITGMPITVTANAGQTKVYGSVDPLVFTYTSAPTGTLPNGDVVSFTGCFDQDSWRECRKLCNSTGNTCQ